MTATGEEAMERMSGLDASFLYFETPTMHMHVTATIVFDPSTVPQGYSFERVKEMIRTRLHLVPPFRRKLAPVPFNLHHPVWVEDPDFDLDYHIRRIGCPAPGSEKELADIAADVASRPLDRSKPLWEIWIVEGLQNGYVASVAKMHHCTIDGVSGANMMVHLLDAEPDPVNPPQEQPWEPEHTPSDVELVAHALRSRAKLPLQAARMVPKTARSAWNFVQTRLGRSDGEGMPAPFTAPRTSFNTTITAHRKIAFSSAGLEEIKDVKNAFGTTVNDVVLAVASGALRRYLADRGELPERSLIGVVPVSVRTDEETDVVGSNRVSAFFTRLYTDIDDPVERLLAIHEANKGAKEEHKAIGADTLTDWAEFAAPTLFSLAARTYSASKFANRHPVIHNLVISNVPGPQFPLYFAGARLVALYPLGPIFDGAALNITVLSYLGQVYWGFITCREVAPHLWQLADYVPEALAELRKGAENVAGSTI